MVLLNLGESITQHRNSAANQQSGKLRPVTLFFPPAKISQKSCWLDSSLMPVTSVVQDLPRQVVFDSFDHQHGQTSGTFPTPFDADVRYRCHWLGNVFEKRDVGFQDMAAAPAQRCVGFQSKVPPDHAGCGNAPHSHPLDACGHLGDVGLQGVIFWDPNLFKV